MSLIEKKHTFFFLVGKKTLELDSPRQEDLGTRQSARTDFGDLAIKSSWLNGLPRFILKSDFHQTHSLIKVRLPQFERLRYSCPGPSFNPQNILGLHWTPQSTCPILTTLAKLSQHCRTSQNWFRRWFRFFVSCARDRFSRGALIPAFSPRRPFHQHQKLVSGLAGTGGLWGISVDYTSTVSSECFNFHSTGLWSWWKTPGSFQSTGDCSLWPLESQHTHLNFHFSRCVWTVVGVM